MTTRPRPTLRTLFLVVLVMAGLCFGNLLHQVLSHDAEGHENDTPLSCWVCAATHHVPGDLGSESGSIATPFTVSTLLAPAEIVVVPTAECGPSSPRAPPLSA